MHKYLSEARRFRGQRAVLVCAGALISAGICARANGQAVPLWTNGEAGVFTHSSGTPVIGGSPYNVPLAITGTPPVLMTHSFSFAPNPGNTNASAGLEHSESTTSVKMIIGSGTGVSQTDPNHVESASSLVVLFNAEWALTNGQLGPPLTGSFSLPIGAKIGAGGSASATVKVDWDYILGPNEFPLRSEYNMTQTWTGAQNVLTSFTAPTVLLNPNVIQPDAFAVLSATITFTANNDDGPTFIEIPTAADFSDMGVTTDQVGTMSIDVSDVVPEPSSLILISTGASALLMRRRRNR
jgi:hypothetical protein